MTQQKLARILQYTLRIAILVWATYEAYMHQVKGILVAPNAHAYCPFGGLESLYKLILSGGYIQKIMPATIALLIITVLLVILLNRAFCGWICPLGTLQSLFDRLARFLKIKKIRVPQTVEKYLQYVKYVGLVVILYFTWRIGDLVYAAYDPWAAYAHIGAGWEEFSADFLIGGIFLLAALIGSLWLPNNFCRYFCPMGAFLGILSKFSPTRIHRNTQSCINCKKCDRVCPAQIAIATEPKVKSMECLSCGECVAVCPVNNTLNYSAGGKITLKWLVYGITTIVVFFGSVQVTKLLGYWKTGYSSATDLLTNTTGVKDPANIKGSMPLDVVAKEFNVPVEAILKQFNFPPDTNTSLMIKEIAQANGKSAEDVKAFIAEYLGLPTPSGESSSHKETETPASTPAPAATTPAPVPAAATPAVTSTVEHATPAAGTVDIRGRTTIGELIGYGMTAEKFKQVTGKDLPENKDLLLKDFASANGLDMEQLREQLQQAVQP